MRREDRPGRTTPRGITRRIWLVDMFARSLQGMAPEAAVKWAAAELRKIYGA